MIKLPVVAILLFSSLGLNDEAPKGYGVGDIVEDFKLENIDGKYVSLADNPNNKGYIVVFTCNTCPWAKLYEQRIIDLHNKYAEKGVPVVAINPNDVVKQPGDTMEEMKKRAKDKGMPYPYLRDDTQEVARAFGAAYTPHIFLLANSDGNYKVSYIGAIDDNPRVAADVTRKYVEEAVDAMLGGEEIKDTQVKGIGCTIKWSES